MPPPTPCNCCTAQAPNETRRKVIMLASAGLAAPWSALAAANGPQKGDYLVEDDAEAKPEPLRVADLKPGKPLLAFPFDKSTGTARDGARSNKLVLMRFAPADLSLDAQARSAGGVLAYSALCTHQACDVKTWLSKEQVLVCFCHASKFSLLDGGKVMNGPATRALPFIPLALDGDRLVIAGAFSAAPGAAA
jgi:rieske iron-sulfur protein